MNDDITTKKNECLQKIHEWLFDSTPIEVKQHIHSFCRLKAIYRKHGQSHHRDEAREHLARIYQHMPNLKGFYGKALAELESRKW